MNILFYGDSNTWGFQGDQPQVRLAYEKRFTGIIANRFPQHHIIEEGLPGRTICINDPLDKGRNGMETLPMLLQTHEPLDLVVIMLGTNDVKERFGANAACIGAGMERLLLKAKSVDCWGGKAPNILVVAPPCIKDGFHDAVMGAGCVEKSRGVAEQLRIVAERQGVHFMDAAECEFNEVDFMHLTCKGHARLAELLTAEVPKLI
mgnify:CR=1 FL=1